MRLSTSTPLLLACAMIVPGANAWTTATPAQTRSTTSLSLSRQGFLQQAAATAVIGAAAGIWQPMAALAAETVSLPNGVSYTITKKGTGPAPGTGELAAIRFAATYGEMKIDNIFDTPEPYYTRVGSGGMIKGVEDVLPLMVVGDRWVLTIPGNLAFGKKGRPASAGKPRIPADATITFDVEIVGLPGREEELIEIIGGDI